MIVKHGKNCIMATQEKNKNLGYQIWLPTKPKLIFNWDFWARKLLFCEIFPLILCISHELLYFASLLVDILL